VTLLAAFPCKDFLGKTAFVICADAQETLDDYRFFLDKLEPHKTGNYEVLLGGAGYANLIEAFELRLFDTLPKSGTRSIQEFKDFVQAELLDFVQVEVAAFLKSRVDAGGNGIDFVIAARATQNSECGCWITRATRLKPVRTFELLGIDAAIYRHLAKRIYSDGLPIGQAARACLYLLSIAKATSTAVDGKPSLAVLQNGGLKLESEEFIKDAEENLQELTIANDKISIALPDLGMPAIEFEAVLQDFVRKAWAIRKKYLTRIGSRIALGAMQGNQRTYAHYEFPSGTGLSVDQNGAITIDDDPYRGLYVGSFRDGINLNQEKSLSPLKLCGKRRVVGSQVFVEVVPCKLPPNIAHNENESCIEDKWLETLSASSSEDDPPDTQ